MTKEEICYRLALIYADNMFQNYLMYLPKQELNRLGPVTRRLFCYFEEAFNAYMIMDEQEFEFVLESMGDLPKTEATEE